MERKYTNPLRTNAGALFTRKNAFISKDGTTYIRMTNGSLRKCKDTKKSTTNLKNEEPNTK